MNGASRARPARPPGQVFTPAPVADLLWRLAWDALAAGGRRPERPVVADPAAGDGAIAAAILRATPSADLTLVELDPGLVSALNARPSGISTSPDPGPRVVHADALTLARGADAPPSPIGRRWGALTPNEVAAACPRLVATGWADAVVANPPYLRETGNSTLFRELRAWSSGALGGLYRKDTDLHVFFWELACRWLRPGGVLAFLTPAYFMEAEAAAPLRAMLTERGRVEAIWRSGRDDVFPGTGVEAAITVWRKKPAHRAAAVSLRDPAALRGERSDAADSVPETRRLDDDGRTIGAVRLAGDGPWWLHDSEELAALAAIPTRLGSLYRIVEGVSTGANRLRAADVALVADGRAGEGIFVLGDDETDALRGDPEFDRLVGPRRNAGVGAGEWVLRVRDRDLPRLDADATPVTPIERHLARFRPVLERRAEMRRNPSRSWYAVAWPRPELHAPGTILTPKWSASPAFAAMDPHTVPMTDFRVLVPRSASVAARCDEVLAWLHGDTIRPWYRHRLKAKGPILEWYGAALAAVPVLL